MKTYEFTLILSDRLRITEELCEQLYEAGCADSSPGVCNGVQEVHFHREANSLAEAIQSAIENVRSVGLEITKIETDEASTIHRLNSQLAGLQA